MDQKLYKIQQMNVAIGELVESRKIVARRIGKIYSKIE